MANSNSHFIPEFHSSYWNLYDTLVKELAKTEKVIFTDANYQTAFITILQKYFPELTLPKQISELVFQKSIKMDSDATQSMSSTRPSKMYWRTTFALLYCNATGASYTTYFINGICSIAPIVPFSLFDVLISSANLWSWLTSLIQFTSRKLGGKIFIPPNELKHVANKRLWTTYSLDTPSPTASSKTGPIDDS
jgi:hypothetical protein